MLRNTAGRKRDAGHLYENVYKNEKETTRNKKCTEFAKITTKKSVNFLLVMS